MSESSGARIATSCTCHAGQCNIHRQTTLGTYLYSILCCTTEVDIYSDRLSECPECHSVFEVRTEGGAQVVTPPFAIPQSPLALLTAEERDGLYWAFRRAYDRAAKLERYNYRHGTTDHSLIKMASELLDLFCELVA